MNPQNIIQNNNRVSFNLGSKSTNNSVFTLKKLFWSNTLLSGYVLHGKTYGGSSKNLMEIECLSIRLTKEEKRESRDCGEEP